MYTFVLVLVLLAVGQLPFIAIVLTVCDIYQFTVSHVVHLLRKFPLKYTCIAVFILFMGYICVRVFMRAILHIFIIDECTLIQ